MAWLMTKRALPSGSSMRNGGAVAHRVLDDRSRGSALASSSGPSPVSARRCDLTHQLGHGAAAPGLAERLALLLLQPQQSGPELVALMPIVGELLFQPRREAHGKAASGGRSCTRALGPSELPSSPTAGCSRRKARSRRRSRSRAGEPKGRGPRARARPLRWWRRCGRSLGPRNRCRARAELCRPAMR